MENKKKLHKFNFIKYNADQNYYQNINTDYYEISKMSSLTHQF